MSNGNEEEAKNTQLDRRSLLRLTGGSTFVALAGCSGSPGDGSNDDNGDDGGDGSSNGGNGGDGGDGGDGDDGGNGDGGGGEPGERVPPIDFVTWTESGSPDNFEASRIITANLEELGLTVELDPQQFPQPIINTLFSERSFDISVISYVGTAVRLDPSFYLNTVLHSNGIESGGWNFSGWANDEFDALADEQQATLDQNQRRELVLEAQRIAFEEQAVTTYVSPNLAIGLNTRRFERPTQSVPGEGLLGMFTLTTIRPRGSKRVLALPQARNSFGTLNPIAVQEAEVNEFNRPIYDTLMRVGPEGRAVNWIISSLDVADDTTVRATLVDGLEWHDGEPVTADDVAFSFEYQTENKAPYVFSYLEPISSVESDGDRTVTFSLNGPYAPFQMLSLSLVPIIPQHIWAERENPSQERNIPPIGSGPFRFERLEEGSVLEMSANKDHPQAPEIDGLLIQLFGNNSTAQQALLRGDIDGMWDVPATLQSDIEQSNDVELYFKPSHSIATLVHNTRRGMPFEDVAFRRAVATAIPNEGIVQQIYNGQASPGGSIISAANEFWHNPDLGHFTYDIEEARTILRDAGYSWDDDGNLRLPS